MRDANVLTLRINGRTLASCLFDLEAYPTLAYGDLRFAMKPLLADNAGVTLRVVPDPMLVLHAA
jgi:hypothetical protein